MVINEKMFCVFLFFCFKKVSVDIFTFLFWLIFVIGGTGLFIKKGFCKEIREYGALFLEKNEVSKTCSYQNKQLISREVRPGLRIRVRITRIRIRPPRETGPESVSYICWFGCRLPGSENDRRDKPRIWVRIQHNSIYPKFFLDTFLIRIVDFLISFLLNTFVQ